MRTRLQPHNEADGSTAPDRSRGHSARTGRLALGLILVALAAPGTALAGGYELPITFNAKHGAQGGTALSYVSGGFSMFLNPAGIGRIDTAETHVATTIVSGLGKATPSFLDPERNIWSRPIRALLPLVGGAVRAHRFITFGLGVFPSGGLAGEFEYKVNPDDAEPIIDSAGAAFIEMTAGMGLNFPLGKVVKLNLGAGYRITYGYSERSRPTQSLNVDIRPTGWDFGGVRVGFQFQFGEHFSWGAAYRNKIEFTLEQNGGNILGADLESLALPTILPARAGTGVRFDWGDFGISFDFEYVFQSQNGKAEAVTVPELPIALAQNFDWNDQIQLRGGFEYRFFNDHWPIRIGLVWESAASGKSYPNAVGTPPASGFFWGFGSGYNHGPWEINVAYVRSQVWTTITEDDLADDIFTECPACGGPGDYGGYLNLFMFDFSYRWD